ncbi:aminopeptidase P family N-terminal domain-containing protein [Mycolicibacterium insubricum]|nr:aminopeptidase P family N-terminal domain-containing protein [Mycolicibacterium insubricum]
MTAGRFETRVYADRLTAAAAVTAAAGLDGLVITPGYDLRYLVGSRAQTFERLTALVIPSAGTPTIVVPRLELAALRESAVPDLAVTVSDWVDGDDPYALVAAALGGAPAAAAVADAMPALHLLPLADRLQTLPVLATEVSSYFTVFTEIGLDHYGRYRDVFVPVAGDWLIAHRLAATDWSAENSTMVG